MGEENNNGNERNRNKGEVKGIHKSARGLGADLRQIMRLEGRRRMKEEMKMKEIL